MDNPLIFMAIFSVVASTIGLLWAMFAGDTDDRIYGVMVFWAGAAILIVWGFLSAAVILVGQLA